MKLPPMNALRAFEAVSRHGSVSKAAEVLCVSQGAVSQQLRNLEDYFGKNLFNRDKNRLTLTDEGEKFATVVHDSLEQIASAAASITTGKTSRRLKISATPSISTQWLLPKLGEFYKLHPDISIVLADSTDLVTFRNDGFDAAIRFSDGNFEDLHSAELITLEIYAVASPAYVENHGKPESIDKPEGHCLIDYYYDKKSVSSQHIHWRDIVTGNLDKMSIDHQVYPDPLQTLTAAKHGQGIALLPSFMFDEEVDKGNLAILSDKLHEYENRYYFISPKQSRGSQALDDFRDWLVEISRAYRKS